MVRSSFLKSLDYNHLPHEFAILQRLSSSVNGFEGSVRTFSHIEQRMVPISHVQHPEQCHFLERSLFLPCDGAIESASPQLRLTVWIGADYAGIVFDHVHRSEQDCQGVLKRLRCDTLEIVRRRMVFGIFSVRGTHETSHRQVETR